MKRSPFVTIALAAFLLLTFSHSSALAWHDETHLAVAKAAGYHKWYNAACADIAKIKAGDVELHNHYTNNPPGTLIDSRMILDQVRRYDQPEPAGHLYGAIIASLRNYIAHKKAGKFGEYHMAYCAHYVGDLSMPLHNTLYDTFNQLNHTRMDGTVEDEILANYKKIKIYPITIRTENDLVTEIARIANLSRQLGYRLESEDRLMTKEEAYAQLSHSASLLKAMIERWGD